MLALVELVKVWLDKDFRSSKCLDIELRIETSDLKFNTIFSIQKDVMLFLIRSQVVRVLGLLNRVLELVIQIQAAVVHRHLASIVLLPLSFEFFFLDDFWYL